MGVFIAEIVIKLIVCNDAPYKYFLDSWNVFDFAIVALSFLQLGGDAIRTLRLIRLLRVLKLVRALPKLRILVMGLVASLSSIMYIGILLMLLIYFYAVVAVTFMGSNDPVNFGDLNRAIVTLLQLSTLDAWRELFYITYNGCAEGGYEEYHTLCTASHSNPALATFFFISFIVFANMILLNLFVGVVTSSIDDAKTELTEEVMLQSVTNNGSNKGKRNFATTLNNQIDVEIFTKMTELNKAMKRITEDAQVLAENHKRYLELKKRRKSSVANISNKQR